LVLRVVLTVVEPDPVRVKLSPTEIKLVEMEAIDIAVEPLKERFGCI
jgi:hypothetical protein